MTRLLPFHMRSLALDRAGFSLVESLVAALTIALVAAGVFGGIQGASIASGNSKHRSIAAGLALEDQERMRGMRIADLANRETDSVRAVDGITFRIHSKATYVEDATGSTSCSTPDARADYIAITSTVRWDGMAPGLKPVQLDSIVTPPTGSFSASQGSVAVQVRDRNGSGVAGVLVDLIGATSYRQTTNQFGCVMFAYITPGAYEVSLSAAGYVNPDGAANPTEGVDVVAGMTKVVSFDYDLAARAEVRFETQRPDGTVVSGRAEALSIAHANLSAPGTRSVPAAGPQPPDAPQSYESLTVTNLYPFASAYGLYTGVCASNDPANHNPPLAGKTEVTFEPGQTAAITVREPALDVVVTRGGLPIPGATVVLNSADADCAQRFVRTTGADGHLGDPGLPYGSYWVCASLAGVKVSLPVPVENFSPTGTSVPLPDLLGPIAEVGSCT